MPKSITDDKLAVLITGKLLVYGGIYNLTLIAPENMIWLGTKVDISILLP